VGREFTGVGFRFGCLGAGRWEAEEQKVRAWEGFKSLLRNANSRPTRSQGPTRSQESTPSETGSTRRSTRKVASGESRERKGAGGHELIVGGGKLVSLLLELICRTNEVETIELDPNIPS
jgi:hypothetical protein